MHLHDKSHLFINRLRKKDRRRAFAVISRCAVSKGETILQSFARGPIYYFNKVDAKRDGIACEIMAGGARNFATQSNANGIIDFRPPFTPFRSLVSSRGAEDRVA